MEDKRELNMDELGQAAGGVTMKIRYTSAAVYNGPGKQYGQIATISTGCRVNYIGSLVTDKEGNTWQEINSPTRGWILVSEAAPEQ